MTAEKKKDVATSSTILLNYTGILDYLALANIIRYIVIYEHLL
jgi:hypothetical protein